METNKSLSEESLKEVIEELQGTGSLSFTPTHITFIQKQINKDLVQLNNEWLKTHAHQE